MGQVDDEEEMSMRRKTKYPEFIEGGYYRCTDCGRLVRDTGEKENELGLCSECFLALLTENITEIE